MTSQSHINVRIAPFFRISHACVHHYHRKLSEHGGKLNTCRVSHNSVWRLEKYRKSVTKKRTDWNKLEIKWIALRRLTSGSGISDVVVFHQECCWDTERMSECETKLLAPFGQRIYRGGNRLFSIFRFSGQDSDKEWYLKRGGPV
jgi:hypothetical protein